MLGPIAVVHWLLDIPFFRQGLTQYVLLVGFPILVGAIGIPLLIEGRIERLGRAEAPTRWDWFVTISALFFLPLGSIFVAAALFD